MKFQIQRKGWTDRFNPPRPHADRGWGGVGDIGRVECHPELNKGSSEFDDLDLERWIHPYQQYQPASSALVYEYIKETGRIKRCFGFGELEALADCPSSVDPGRYYGWGSATQMTGNTGRYHDTEFQAVYVPFMVVQAGKDKGVIKWAMVSQEHRLTLLDFTLL